MNKDPEKYQTTISTWNKIAQLYNDKFMELDIYNETYDTFCSSLNNNSAHILEIGCGPGNITRYLKKKLPESRILATDVSPNMIALAKKNIETEFQIMDARNINEIQETFDGIVCGFCIPYIDEFYLKKLIRDSSSLLQTNGIIYLSCIEGNYSDSKFEQGSSGDKAFVHYYLEEELIEILSANNFELQQSFRIPYKKSDGKEDIHLVLIAKKDEK